MESSENCKIVDYDSDLNKVRCPMCNKVVHGVLDLEDDYEIDDEGWDWDPCEHIYFCEVFSYGLELESTKFKKDKEEFEKIVQKWAAQDLIHTESYALAFPAWTQVKGSKLLYIQSGPSIGGIDIFYAFIPAP
jgi:hypothetical protein